jgi:biopolymer transport protein ExbD
MMKFRRPKTERPHIEITPIIDMVFILLVFFMLSSAFLKPVIKMNLPVAVLRDEPEKKNIAISITKDERIYLNQKPVQKDQLEKAVEELIRENPDAGVVFSGDEGIKYGLFVEVMDMAKLSGAKTIALEHETEE